MSGAQIGGAIGFVVGAYFGYPQLGYAIGSAIGGAIDPEVVKMPGIGDAQTQTSSDNVPIPVVYGTPPPFMGNIIDGEQKARKITKEDDGKGSGVVTVTEHFFLTSAIGICEGEIEGVAWITQDGNLVYDRRPNPKIPPADTAKFASKIRLYNGGETQMPDPALEALHGVGNTPYYRGLAYMVIVDDDRTHTQGRVGQYAFGVVKTGTTQEFEEIDYPEPTLARFIDSDWPLADPLYNYEFTGYIGTQQDGGGTISFSAATPGGIINYFTNYDYSGVGGGSRKPDKYLGYSASTTGAIVPSIGLLVDDFGVSNAVEQPSVVDNFSLVLVYNDLETNQAHGTLGFSGFCGIGSQVVQDRRGTVAALYSEAPGGQITLMESCDSGGLYGTFPLCIRVTRKLRTHLDNYGDPCDEQMSVLLPDAAGYTIDCDATIDKVPDQLETQVGNFKMLSVEAHGHDISLGRDVYSSYSVGPVIPEGHPDFNNEVFWTNEYEEAFVLGKMPPHLEYGIDYPESTNSAVVAIRERIEIVSGEVFLKEIQEDLADRCDVSIDKIDADELATDVVPGYLVAVDANGADCSRVLQQVYFYDMPEYDGAIRCIKRGAVTVGELTNDDFIDVESEDDDIRPQQVEFPRKIHLAYPDPFANYAITKQSFVRESINVTATGEDLIQTPIPFNRDEAAQRVDVMGKIAWASIEGRMKRTLPEEYTTWVPSDCYVYNGKRFRIERTEIGEGTNAIDAVYDRQSAYESIATGASTREPAGQTSGLKGPTRFEFVNVSPLLDAHDQLGIYFGVCGILEGWIGCTLMASIDAGANYVQLGEYTRQAVMGYTLDVLPKSSPWIFDPEGSVTVSVHGGEPSTASFFSILNEGNAAIIGEEIIQYQTVTEVSERTFMLSGLTRARHNTQVAYHDAHTRFVVLTGLNFFQLPSAWIGRDIQFYIQSLGTPGGTGYTENHVWKPALIQTEWSPVHFRSEDIGSATLIEWIGRGRLGTNANPFNSSFFDGYRITFSNGTTSVSYIVQTQEYTYTDAQRTTDFGGISALNVSISAMNRITGASAALLGTI